MDFHNNTCKSSKQLTVNLKSVHRFEMKVLYHSNIFSCQYKDMVLFVFTA